MSIVVEKQMVCQKFPDSNFGQSVFAKQKCLRNYSIGLSQQVGLNISLWNLAIDCFSPSSLQK